MSLTFSIERLEDVWDDMFALAKKHWQETQQYRHTQPFNPQFERYNQYAKVGLFLPFTARENGRMVGYAGLYITPSMHTQENICTEDTFYLLPEYRKGWNALRFIKFMERECELRGVVEISLTVPYTTEVSRLHIFLGYTPVATVFSKHLRTNNV